jgi:ribonuclease D
VRRRRGGPAPESSELEFTLVEDDVAFGAVLRALGDAPVYALDTEFHRERTYYPQLALLQVAWPDGLALIDPLSVDLTPFAAVLDGPGVAVLHAADQDLEVLDRACGTIPARLFDTQVAAGFVGLPSASLASLYDRLLGRRLPKADRLTDWLRRPLEPSQLSYAAADVAYLLDLRAVLCDDLSARARTAWVEDECEEARRRQRGARDPLEAWRRIKEARQLRGRALSIAQTVAAWRETTAARLDVPPRFVLPDLGVVGIAQRPPSTAAELRAVRSVEDRHLRMFDVTELLAVVRDARNAPPRPVPESVPPELERELRPAVSLISAWVSQLARELEIDTAALATRADIEALLRGEDGRLSHGWRADAVGDVIRRLVAGEGALAFERGTLVLEQRSHQPLG